MNNLKQWRSTFVKMDYSFVRHVHSMSTTGEMANKEDMGAPDAEIARRGSQMMVANNEMVMEHGQRAVALRDERVVEMQSAINELTESLTKKDEIIATKEGIARERFARIREMANMTHQKEDEHLWEKNKLQMEINHLMKLNENEVASKEWHEKRFLEEKAEYSVRTVQASTKPPNEMDDLREKLRIAEERAQQHYEDFFFQTGLQTATRVASLQGVCRQHQNHHPSGRELDRNTSRSGGVSYALKLAHEAIH